MLLNTAASPLRHLKKKQVSAYVGFYLSTVTLQLSLLLLI